jgi:hypothetical protein
MRAAAGAGGRPAAAAQAPAFSSRVEQVPPVRAAKGVKRSGSTAVPASVPAAKINNRPYDPNSHSHANYGQSVQDHFSLPSLMLGLSFNHK